MLKALALLSFLLTAIPAHSDSFSFEETPESTQKFVEANILGIFYHELGHALIDILGLPVFGQEEDAADVASILMIHLFYDEDGARALAYDTAFGFLGENAYDRNVAWWDTHGPNLQRYYNLVCLFYGANPEEREDLAVELGLPEERAETCEEEYELAADSWELAFAQMEEGKPGSSFGPLKVSGESDATTFTAEVLEAEIEALNKDFSLPQPLKITVEACGEPNAFYDLGTIEIIMCSEFADHLTALAPKP